MKKSTCIVSLFFVLFFVLFSACVYAEITVDYGGFTEEETNQYYWQQVSACPGGTFPSADSACDLQASCRGSTLNSISYGIEPYYKILAAYCHGTDANGDSWTGWVHSTPKAFYIGLPNEDAPLQCSIGNPINPSSGNKHQLEPLIDLAAIYPVKLDLIFNSRRPEKWRHSFSRSVVRVTDLQIPNNTSASICEKSKQVAEAPGGFARASIAGSTPSNPARFFDSPATSVHQVVQSTPQDACLLNWNGFKNKFHYSWIGDSASVYEGNGQCAIYANDMKRMTLNIYQTGGIGALDSGRFDCADMDPANPPSLTSTDPINVRFTRHDGGLVRFIYNTGTSQLDNESGSGERAEFITSGTDIIGYRFYSKEDEVEEYDDQGKLITITSLDGHVQTLSYTADTNLLDLVSNSTGEYLDFNYETVDVGTENQFNRIQNITDHTDRSWTMRYDANENLEYIDMPDGTSRQYHYDTDPQRLDYLTGITDERGNRYASWTYDANGKADSSAHGPDADIDKVTITYDEANNNHTITKHRKSGIDDVVTPIDSTYYTHAAGGSKVVAKITGPGCSACGASDVEYEHNPDTGYLEYKIENGIRTEYGNYNSKGQAGYIIEAATTTDARRVDYTYDSRFHAKIATITEPSVLSGSNKITTYIYDDFGNVISETINGFKPDGTAVSRATTYEYSGPYNQLSKIDGPRTDVNDIINFEYYSDDAFWGNNRARLRHVKDKDGNNIRSSINYNATGKIAGEYRSNNLYMSYEYELGSDRLSGMLELDLTDFQARFTYWTYLATGEVESITRARNTVDETSLTLGYDDARRLTRITDGLGNYIEYILDSEGNIEKENIHDAAGILNKTLTQTFDDYNQLDNFSEKNRVVNSDFNANGALDKSTDGKGSVTDYSYDNLLRLTQTIQDQSGSDSSTADALTQYGYDVQNNLISVTDANSGATTYEYDDLGNLLSQTSPDTGTVQFTHDEAGNIATQTDAKSQLFTYSYDHYNRLTSQDTPGIEDDVGYVYDTCLKGYGRLCEAVRSNSTTRYQYNALGDIVNVAQDIVTWGAWNQANTTVAYTYDGVSRVKTMTYPSGVIVTYGYDAAGQMNNVDLDQSGTITTLFNVTRHYPFGAINDATYGNDKSYTGYMNNDYRPFIINDGEPTTAKLYYDENGNPNTIWYPQGSGTLTYDAHNRLDTVTGSLGNFDFDYDIVGNKIQKVQDGVTVSMSYEDGSNRMNSLDSDTVVVDANGNTTALRGMSFSYTADNRLKMSNTGVLFGYNGLGQRSMKITTAPGIAGTYGYSQSVVYLYGLNGELLAEVGPTGTVVKEYIYMDGQPLTMLDHAPSSGEAFLNGDFDNDGSISIEDYFIYYHNYGGSTDPAYDVNGDGVRNTADNSFLVNCAISSTANCNAASYSTSLYYIHKDHLGTPKLMTNELGAAVWRATADPFGKASVDDDVDGDGVSVTLNIRQPGQYYDGETGLYYNYFRYYDPSTGRYITSDPIGLAGGINTYAYALNNPVKYTDPNGLCPICPALPYIAGAAAAYAGYDFLDTAADIRNEQDSDRKLSDDYFNYRTDDIPDFEGNGIDNYNDLIDAHKKGRDFKGSIDNFNKARNLKNACEATEKL